MSALFTLLTRLLPSDYDATNRASMCAMYEERARDARSRGAASHTRFVTREVGSMVRIILFHRRTEYAGMNGSGMWVHMGRELRHAARRFARSPGFALAAVATLGIAIGANTAIFTLVHRVILAPLPYASSDRIVALEHDAPGVKISDLGMASGLYEVYATLPEIEAIAMYNTGSATITVGTGTPEEVADAEVTPSLASVLSKRPALGRWFTDAEGKENGPNVVVLTNALWLREFGGDPRVIGRTLRIDEKPYAIIGVMDAHFAFPDDKPQFLIPLRYTPKVFGGFNHQSVALLKAGRSIATLRKDQDRIIANTAALFPGEPKLASVMAEARLAAKPITLKERVLGGVAQMFWVIFAAVAIVLLVACANLANLFLVRAEGRYRDVAVRRALGAGSGSLRAYFLSESLLVAALGGLIGVALAAVSVKLLVTNAPVALPRLHEVHTDGWSVLFATVVSITAGIATGVAPLLGSRGDISAALQDSSRGTTAGASHMRARKTLMAAQLALAVILLAGASLMLQTFRRLQAIDPGFRTESRLVFSIGLSETSYQTSEKAAQFHELAMARLAALPGVTGVAMTTALPLGGDGHGDPLARRDRSGADAKLQEVVQFRRVSTSFFDVMGIPVAEGRTFNATDQTGHTNVVIIDRALAASYFPDRNAIGQQLRPFNADSTVPWLTVIGIAGNTATNSLREDAVPHIYYPLRSDADYDTPSTHNASYVLTTKRDPLAVLPAVRTEMARLDPNVAVARPRRLTDVVAASNARPLFTMTLLVVAGLVSLILGLIGVYAVISYAVSQRTGEIGVRLALGARPRQVSAMILRESGPVFVGGIGAGVTAAVAAARVARSLLYGVTWNDPATYIVVAFCLLCVALAASWVPARRASHVSPLQSLRGN